MAYTLLEATRLWQVPRYAAIGRELLSLIKSTEIVQAGSVGPVLLPGPQGFVLDKGRFRVNPSYMPEFMFRYLAVVDSQGPWQAVWDGFRRMAPRVYRAGVAPDNFVVDSRGTVMPDTERDPSGSYDAIRVYLWAGMSGTGNREILDLLPHYALLIRQSGNPPEKVNPHTGSVTKADYSPLGFSGAVLPYLKALGDQPTLQQQRQRVQAAASRARQGETTHYYDQVLVLFGTGWVDGQYRFDDQGRLSPRWFR
jgi:endoglucanase